MIIGPCFTTAVVFFLTLQGFSKAERPCARYAKVCEAAVGQNKDSNKQLHACDTVTDGGRWFIIQRQTSQTINFTKNWENYKNGFGQLYSNYWIGNHNISCQTAVGKWELRIDMTYGGKKYYAKYKTFKVDPEKNKYRLTINGFSGDVTDDFKYHNGMAFSTLDRDNDKSATNCAEVHQSGWWFADCREVNLNGQFTREPGASGDGIIWKSLTTLTSSLTSVEMKIREVK